jgi:crotonobetainyl-CoA:carnitine CoA-transferase CaiB-like acyl-CoA transferase
MLDPQTDALGILQTVPRTKVVSVGIPLKFNGLRPRLRLPAPGLGEHTADVLKTITAERAE